MALTTEELGAFQCVFDFLRYQSNGDVSYRSIVLDSSGKQGGVIDGSKFRRHFLQDGAYDHLHEEFRGRLLEIAENNIDVMPPWVELALDCLKGISRQDRSKDDPLREVFPGVRKVTREDLMEISENISGLYRFARLRHHTTNPISEPVITGLTWIKPYEDANPPHLEFEDIIPNTSVRPEANLPNLYRGKVVCCDENNFLVGTERHGGTPVFVGLSYSKEPMDNIVGLLLRRHTGSMMMCGRILFRRHENEKLIDGLGSLSDLKTENLNGFGLFSEQQFEELFRGFKIEDLLNASTFNGKTMLTTRDPDKRDTTSTGQQTQVEGAEMKSL